MDALRGTRRWVKLVGILLFVAVAFTVLGALGMMAGIGMKAPPLTVRTLLGVVYLAIALVYLFLGLYLVRYSAAIGRLIEDGQVRTMEVALQCQQKFWRLAGILLLVMVVIALFGIAAAIVIPIVAGR
jgi:hypothetical protein